VTVPDVVFREVLAGEHFDHNVQAIRLAATTWLRVETVSNTASELDPNQLDAGELAVLSLAIESPGTTVILDDLAARVEAARRNIPLLGTAGILLRAKEHGRIPAVQPALDSLRQAGLYMTDDVYRIVLRIAGESAIGT